MPGSVPFSMPIDTSLPRARRGSSWFERFFSTLTQKQIRRGVFHSVQHLEQCLKDYIKTYNEDPKPLVWTKSASEILTNVERAKRALARVSTQSLL